ncbi:MAG: hypothetical protein J2P45_27720 [Candidatus Dormibacteraeota bacterium]|nr:hypothetical protein [Candidatus Dormibacteraeota bacterium]
MAYIYLDGELIGLPDVEQLGSVHSSGLVPLLRKDGGVIGMASLGQGGFITIGEPPVVLEPGEEEEEDEDFDGA